VSIVAVRQDLDGVDVTLSDGRVERFDLVVGADGLHSRIRALAFSASRDVERPLGCHVAAFRVPDYPHRDELVYVSHTVPQRQAARVSLRGGDTLMLLVCRSELIGDDDVTQDRVKDVLRKAFGQMAWEVPEMLRRMDAVEDLYFDRVSQIHLDRWTSGRVALVGDAAACASLLAGEGAGLAMVEAYVLAGELHRGGRDLAAGLRRYEARLVGFVREKQKTAVRMRGFFAPQTAVTLAIRNVAVNLMALPFVAKLWIGGALVDRVALPEYEARPLSVESPLLRRPSSLSPR
jgi:2-polyprenyl-6-methoxyphenol hydroxylase-like FAD-dependent oxidoreductase